MPDVITREIHGFITLWQLLGYDSGSRHVEVVDRVDAQTLKALKQYAINMLD
ncbi:hypothetical protein [Periweissella cryptocerci]|uniref:hypothetical protein n=1 Tax=Periweissella cryptocerci TaxID=2506420 RepID=UPI0014053D2A|nr:hypothetical protein [Periweissella cryptocerci]